jgi:hypothetical protein
MEAPNPKVLAMLLADRAHLDPATRKLSLFGILDGFAGPSLPVVVPRLVVHVALTEGRGTVPFTLRIIDADEADDPAHEFAGEITFPDPLHITSIVHDVQGLPFRRAGHYRVQLLVRGGVLFERRLEVRVGPVPSAPGQQPR